MNSDVSYEILVLWNMVSDAHLEILTRSLKCSVVKAFHHGPQSNLSYSNFISLRYCFNSVNGTEGMTEGPVFEMVSMVTGKWTSDSLQMVPTLTRNEGVTHAVTYVHNCPT